MTIHYHGTPITPYSTLLGMAGKCFCVSFANPRDVETIRSIGQSVMYDNGAFSVWRKTKDIVNDWTPYYEWVEPLIQNSCNWAVIPDEIDGGSQVQDYLVSQWPFGNRGAPVWHLDEPVERFLRLCDDHPRVCIGSTGEYAQVGSDDWHKRMDVVFESLVPRHRFLPWIHMLRGMQTVRWGYPFASVDSTDVAKNHHRRRCPLVGAKLMAELWDSVQCPSVWTPDAIDNRSDCA